MLTKLETLKSLFLEQEVEITIKEACNITFQCYIVDIRDDKGETMFEVQLRDGLIKFLPYDEILVITFLDDNTNYLYVKNRIDN